MNINRLIQGENEQQGSVPEGDNRTDASLLLGQDTELTIIHKDEEYELRLSESDITSIAQFIHEVYMRTILDFPVRQMSGY